MPELRTAGLHHITLVSGDATRTVAFYRDLLGLHLVKRTVDYDEPASHHLYFGDAAGTPGTLVTCFEWKGRPRGNPGLGGIHHLALGVATAAAQLRWKRWLTDRGVRVIGPYNRGYFHSIYFRDPDRQVVEIATAGPGYGYDEPMDALGGRTVMPPGAEIRGARDDAAIAARTWPEPVAAITPEMTLDGLHHVTGMTDDLVRADEFLDRALGLRLVKRSVNQEEPDIPHWFWAAYDGHSVAPRSSVSFFGWPPTWLRSRRGVGQAHHVAFRAGSAEDQLAWRDHLLGLGLRASPVKDRTYFRSIYFRAPDGLLLELASDGPGLAADEPSGHLGAGLMLPAWLEEERHAIAGALTSLD